MLGGRLPGFILVPPVICDAVGYSSFRALAEHHSLVTPHIPGVFTSGVGGFYALPPLISIIRLSRYWESSAPEGHQLSGAVP